MHSKASHSIRPEGLRPPGLFALLATVALFGLGACSSERARPNVLLITVDTLRADHTSLHGYPYETTPALDRWAAQGVVFERALSASSWTLPSMSMLLTGQAQVNNEGRVFDGQQSLAELLKAAGYSTTAVVANAILTPERGFADGFDDYQLYERPESGGRAMGWLADEVTGRGLEAMERAQTSDKPFFLSLHYFDPHDPYKPAIGKVFDSAQRLTKERMAKHAAALRPEHRAYYSPEIYRGIEDRIARYDSEILQLDQGLRTLFDWLERSGVGDNTLVVLTADHGEGLWQRAATEGDKLQDVFFAPLYFQHGEQLYDEQIHVPLIFRGPGVAQGVRLQSTVSTLDIVPTVLALLDVAAPPGLDGLALLGAGQNGETPQNPPERSILSICSRGTALTRAGLWRYHLPREYRLEKGVQPELFNLEQDPAELVAVIDKSLSADLEAEIQAWLEKHEERFADQLDANESAGDREAMEALGYIDSEMTAPINKRGSKSEGGAEEEAEANQAAGAGARARGTQPSSAAEE